jgi:tRNA-2-methylthio-N6-dimethylallyladenosine synthase
MPQLSIETAENHRYLYIQTFGCQMNEYDSLRVQRILGQQGYLPTSDPEHADVIFLNTCSVREKPEQKVYSYLGRLRSLKVRNPGVKIIVAGCVAQQLGKKLLERFDFLDLVMGTRGICEISELLHLIQERDQRLAHLPEGESEDGRRQLFEQSASIDSEVVAPVTIMQGCNNFCTYCIVPYVRGRERSRPSGEILQEIRLLHAGGAREILLLGQNVNSYGKGLPEKFSFVDLLHLISARSGISRLRFTTSHPKDLTDELIDCFAELPLLCKYLHLPVQAGSDRILKGMNRSYTASHYLARIARLRRVCPQIGLSSDVMVGFPGETEEDFAKTLQLLQEVQFDNLFSFRYSDRPYAKSSDYPDKVPDGVKSRRLMELQSLQADISLRKNLNEIGSVQEVLVEGLSKNGDGQLTGRTQQNRVVNFESPIEAVGQIVRVKIVAAFSHSLRGEIMDDRSCARSAEKDPKGIVDIDRYLR